MADDPVVQAWDPVEIAKGFVALAEGPDWGRARGMSKADALDVCRAYLAVVSKLTASEAAREKALKWAQYNKDETKATMMGRLINIKAALDEPGKAGGDGA